MNANEKFLENLSAHQVVMNHMTILFPKMESIAKKMLEVIKNGGKIFWMGNGGSAADAQHMAAELIGRFRLERPAIASIALTTDSSILTCLSNDYDFSVVFSRQLEGLCNEKDLVVGISTSGNSENVLKGIRIAKEKGAYTVGLAGRDGGALLKETDCCLVINSHDTARIQEAHIFIGHNICEYVEILFSKDSDLKIS